MSTAAGMRFDEMRREALADPETFWGRVADELPWFRRWDHVYEPDPPSFRWFVGGRTNMAHNALDHHVDRLADDHANARALARGLSQVNGIEVQQPETNLVFFKPDGAGVTGDKMVEALRKRGVLLAMMDGRIRACTHLDATAGMIEEMVGLVREIVREA